MYSASVCGNSIETGTTGYIVIVSYLSSDPVAVYHRQIDIWDPQYASFEGDYLIVLTGDNVFKAFYFDILKTEWINQIDQG